MADQNYKHHRAVISNLIQLDGVQVKTIPGRTMANMTASYLSIKTASDLPRLPLEGNLDLTYRCNNTCRHCWLWLPPNTPEQQAELSFDDIKKMAGEARALGTRAWHLSGGEPMLRDDFADIFDLLTRKAATYSLNTNGTLITPVIAQLLKRKGSKMVALYGATHETYDRVTRHPGGFELALRGFRYLQEAGAGFTVQLIPMGDNWHEWEQMQALAQSLSPHWRVGAAWLYHSASGSPARNAEIDRQRLDPSLVVALDQPIPHDQDSMDGEKPCQVESDDRLFAGCIAGRQDFHIDPYGQMSWCAFIKDPALRYDLRQGTFRQAWEEFIPSCADKVRGGEEWRAACGICERRADCRWCAVYAYLETGRYQARIPYLCQVAKEAQAFKARWQNQHRRYFRIAGITVRIESDLDFDALQFKPELAAFRVEGSGDDNVTLRHHFELPDLQGKDLGQELYHKPPWAISRQANGGWVYRGISPDGSDHDLHRVATFNAEHTRGTIYSLPRDLKNVRENGWQSLSLFPTDQIWLAPLLADRQAVLLHSAASILNGQGLVFVGHSSAGKSTTMEMLKAAGIGVEILCDDRNVVRKWDTGKWRVHGTWSHGTTLDVSPASAPLRAILFLQQAPYNELTPLTNRKEIWKHLLATLIRPMVTAAWWQKELDVLEQIVQEVPCYTMKFDTSGVIVKELRALVK